MIELGPKTEEEITYDIAWLYCLTLVSNRHKDWRLPTGSEYMNATFSFSWYEDRPVVQTNPTLQVWYCQPVRTV